MEYNEEKFGMLKRFRSELPPYYDEQEAESIMYLLLEHVSGLEKVQLLGMDAPYSEEWVIYLQDALTRLKASEPVQYIIGETHFMGLRLRVNSDVLIPRPETEELVNWILSENTSTNPRILDIGTGSGCIALGLKSGLLESTVTGIDISQKAIDVASYNSDHNECNVEFICEDIFNMKPNWTEQFDVIVSNPPYVLSAGKTTLHKNVVDNEPHQALFVPDNDPLVFYKEIARRSKDWLSGKGSLYFEINEEYGAEVVNMLAGEGFEDILLKKDLYEKDRMVKAMVAQKN